MKPKHMKDCTETRLKEAEDSSVSLGTLLLCSGAIFLFLLFFYVTSVVFCVLLCSGVFLSYTFDL